MTALAAMRMEENTIILFCSDHGDMLGERGLWFKMSFFEGAARVPLMMRIPGQSPSTVMVPVSTIDVTPTLAALAGIDLDEIQPWTDGNNLLPLIENAASAPPVLMEYVAEGSIAPLVGIRDGDFKFIHCPADRPQLFDLASDPDEMQNLEDDPAYADKMAHFTNLMNARWDLERFDAEVRESQARRHIVYAALRQGHYYPWDYQPLQLASERYMRNHMDLNVLEETKRFPRGD